MARSPVIVSSPGHATPPLVQEAGVSGAWKPAPDSLCRELPNGVIPLKDACECCVRAVRLASSTFRAGVQSALANILTNFARGEAEDLVEQISYGFVDSPTLTSAKGVPVRYRVPQNWGVARRSAVGAGAGASALMVLAGQVILDAVGSVIASNAASAVLAAASMAVDRATDVATKRATMECGTCMTSKRLRGHPRRYMRPTGRIRKRI